MNQNLTTNQQLIMLNSLCKRSMPFEEHIKLIKQRRELIAKIKQSKTSNS